MGGFWNQLGNALGGAALGGVAGPVGSVVGAAAGAGAGTGTGAPRGPGPNGQPFPTNPYTMPAYRGFSGGASVDSGDNPWTQAMRAQSGQQFTADQGIMRNQSQGSIDTGIDNLAMTGGLASGGGERLAAKGNASLMGNLQGLSRDKGMRDLQIGATGAQQNMDLSKFNTGLAFQENQNSNQAALDAWKTNSGIWAATQFANAQAPTDDGKHWYNPTSWFA